MATIAFIIFIILILPSIYGIISEYITEKNNKNKPSELSEMYKIEMMVGKENSIDTDNR